MRVISTTATGISRGWGHPEFFSSWETSNKASGESCRVGERSGVKFYRAHRSSIGRTPATIRNRGHLKGQRRHALLLRDGHQSEGSGWVRAEREPIVLSFVLLSVAGKLTGCRIRLLFPYGDFPVFPCTDLCPFGQSFQGLTKSDGLSPILRPLMPLRAIFPEVPKNDGLSSPHNFRLSNR